MHINNYHWMKSAAAWSLSTRIVVSTNTEECRSEWHQLQQCSRNDCTILQGIDGVICYIDDSVSEQSERS